MRTDHELAQVIWNYMHVGQTPAASDLILCIGSHDQSPAWRAVELYQQKLAPKILFSGGFGRITKHTAKESEAAIFAAVARQTGVPAADILVEEKAANTGKNIAFSEKLLRARKLQPRRIIVVSKPYMERRTLAAFEKQWLKPQPQFTCTSPQVSFGEYCKNIPERQIISLMVGDLQRIREYAKLGFQTPQPIPDEVWDAYQQLVAARLHRAPFGCCR